MLKFSEMLISLFQFEFDFTKSKFDRQILHYGVKCGIYPARLLYEFDNPKK